MTRLRPTATGRAFTMHLDAGYEWLALEALLSDKYVPEISNRCWPNPFQGTYQNLRGIHADSLTVSWAVNILSPYLNVSAVLFFRKKLEFFK